MTVQVAVEAVYLLLIVSFAAFTAAFYVLSKRPPKASVPEEDHTQPRMAPIERRWLYVLFAVVIAGNLITLSPLIPASDRVLWDSTEPAKVVEITMENYTFRLPEEPILVPLGEVVEFVVTSPDVTYGLGVFRHDGSLVLQMQVVPLPHVNRIRWAFDEVGEYDLRSTEYSGPPHSGMYLPDVLVVAEAIP